MYTERTEWKKPLGRVLEGYGDLLRETSKFPTLEGRLPALGELPELKDIEDPMLVSPIIVVIAVVATAARPQPAVAEEILQAKLLDVYSPQEREALRDAIALVRENPDLVEATLGITHENLGEDFMDRLDRMRMILA